MIEPSQDEVDKVLERWNATPTVLQQLILIRLLEELAIYQDALQEIAGRGPEGWAARVAGRALRGE
jgi:hypothetical protein